jgi:glutamate racemase
MIQRLGIIDWGIGGISVFKRLKTARPDLAITYLSDTGAIPYGRMSRRELVKRIETVIGALALRGVTHVAVGCNAASTVVNEISVRDVHLEGVIASAADMVIRENPLKLGIIGGRRTILSGSYRKALAPFSIDIRQRIAQPLSALVEKGDLSSAALSSECMRILSPLRGCSHLLLACTHYPAISAQISEALGSKTVLLDPVDEFSRRILGWPLEDGGADDILTTGNRAAMGIAAERTFGVRLPSIEAVNL